MRSILEFQVLRIYTNVIGTRYQGLSLSFFLFVFICSFYKNKGTKRWSTRVLAKLKYEKRTED